VLHSFCSQANCADGDEPHAGLIQDVSGNFYGTTWQGGGYSGVCIPWGCGTVFELDNKGNYTVLHDFCSQANCADGEWPYAGLIVDVSGNLYGTTEGGGASLNGTIFKLDREGEETVLYSFCSQVNCADGSEPYGSLIEDASGNLYGTTLKGGTLSNCPYSSGCGTVFKLDSKGNYTVLYSFCSQANCTDGYGSYAGLVQDISGNLYGTASGGGANNGGVVFKVDSAGNYSVLYSFCSQNNCTDGYNPNAGLILDAARDLYGTTGNGGATNGGVAVGGGTVYKLDTTGNLTVLHTFCTQLNCADGGGPEAGLIQDRSGNFYGTTSAGGPNGAGTGTVFKLDSAGNYTILYSFCSQTNCTDGYLPFAGVIMDSSGDLYGTTYSGGAVGGNGVDGVIFKLSIGTTTTLSLSPSIVPVGSPGPVVMTATVAPVSGSAVPTGTVTFLNGSTQIATGTLNNGVATFNYDPSSLALGSYSITASYGGDSTFAGSTSSAQPLFVAIATTTSLSLSPSSTTAGSNALIILRATVTPASGGGFPGGTVTFSNGATEIGNSTLTAGVATYNYYPSLAAGTYSILASFPGDDVFVGSTSSAQTLTVNPSPDFTIAANPTTVTAGSPGQQGTTTLTIAPIGGFNQTIALSGASCSGLPTGAGCSFNPASLTPNGGSANTTLAITTTAASSSMLYSPLAQRRTLFFALVLPGLLILGATGRGKRRSARQVAGLLVLSLSLIELYGCGGGSGTGGGSEGGGTPAGTYTVTVTATASSLSHSIPLTLVVK
jgi:uncharacterized repeat protein (TIGR03803 family)